MFVFLKYRMSQLHIPHKPPTEKSWGQHPKMHTGFLQKGSLKFKPMWIYPIGMISASEETFIFWRNPSSGAAKKIMFPLVESRNFPNWVPEVTASFFNSFTNSTRDHQRTPSFISQEINFAFPCVGRIKEISLVIFLILFVFFVPEWSRWKNLCSFVRIAPVAQLVRARYL